MRWTQSDVDRLTARQKTVSTITVSTPSTTPSKYGNQAITENGQRYDSKLELRCARWLELRKAAGEIAWYIRQVPFLLEGGIRYRADFLVVLSSGGVEIIDAKGFLTVLAGNKHKQMRERYGIEVKLWSDKRA